LFDPWATPDAAPGSWLDWLSGVVGVHLDENWTPPQRRRVVAGAFRRLARRGTVADLRDVVTLHAGVEAIIEEPAHSTSVWCLGETSTLGFTTQLAAAEAQGAVLGTTAITDRSHLIDPDDYGAALFEDLAHRFCVRVRADALAAPGARQALLRILEREKPAHTTCTLGVLELELVVGLQACVGEDAYVAGPARPLRLDDGRLGVGDRLSPIGYERQAAAGEGLRIGANCRVA
jgi:hypothetical protein